MSIVVVGTIGYDTVDTNHGSVTGALGGALATAGLRHFVGDDAANHAETDEYDVDLWKNSHAAP